MTDKAEVWIVDDDRSIRWVLEKAMEPRGLDFNDDRCVPKVGFPEIRIVTKMHYRVLCGTTKYDFALQSTTRIIKSTILYYGVLHCTAEY